MLRKWINAHKNKQTDSKIVHLIESTRALSNPGCGWYHLYSFNLAEDSFLYIDCEDEELVLLRIDIHAFRTCEQIPRKALDRADRILTFFAQHKKGIILRIVYDIDGHGMEHEPSKLCLVKNHMMQLGAVIRAHEGEILVHQGLFVGSWGEMHNSKFLMGGRMEELALTFAKATGGTCPIAVRKPSQFRCLSSLSNVNSAKSTAHLEQTTFHPTFTLFNDGIFGSETDLGTYDTRSRQDELAWQKIQMQHSFCGGEVLGGMTLTGAFLGTDRFFSILDWQRAVKDLAKMHISYLNSVYKKELLDDWKAQRAMWNGEEMSGYEYIGRHLGYRFTVTSVSMTKNKKEIVNNIPQSATQNTTQSATQNAAQLTVRITIRNTGFANLCEEAVGKLLFVETKVALCFVEIACDARTWDSGTDTTIECFIPQKILQMQEEKTRQVNVFFQLIRKRDGRILAFANEEYDHSLGVYLFDMAMVPS